MSKEISIQQIKGNNGENGNPLWIVIDNKVYDVTKFNYPNGQKLETKGEDRKEEFIKNFGKSVDATFLIGLVANSKQEKNEEKKDDIEGRDEKKCPISSCKGYSKYLIIGGVVISALAFGISAYIMKKKN